MKNQSLRNSAGCSGRFSAKRRRFPARAIWRLLILAIVFSGAFSLRAQTPAKLTADAQTRFDAQLKALRADKAARTPAQNKISASLLFATREERSAEALAAAPKLHSGIARPADGRVVVDLDATVTPALLEAIKTLGGEVVNSFPADRAVRARVPLAQLETLAARDDVKFITPGLEPRTNAYTGEGVATHRADYVQSNFNILGSTTTKVTGAGIKVGVMSDSNDYADGAISSGDLPGNLLEITGQNGRPATGEGTTMMEVVHEIAPDAPLYFATGKGGLAQMAANIRSLQAQGCKVIIDDLTYGSESPFYPSVIDGAIKEVCSKGVLYFSSAANTGNKSDGTSAAWEGDYVSSSAAGTLDWGSGSNFNKITSASNKDYAILHWSDPYGASGNDYDLFTVDDSGNVLLASNDTQAGSGNPLEFIPTIATGQNLYIELDHGSSRFLHASVYRGKLTYATTGNALGHNAAIADNAFCVAATPAANYGGSGQPAGTYPSAFTTGLSVETFSSDGPRRRFYDDNGQPFTPGNLSSSGGKLFRKPDITAADGTKNSGVYPADSGLNPFFGTSCAAPHAGAIAALLLSYNPSLTGAQVRAALQNTALDIEAAGYDQDSGYGIIMPDRAIAAVAAAIQLTPANYTFTAPVHGATATQTFPLQIKNTGLATLNWKLNSNTGFLLFKANELSGTIAPNGTQTLTITLDNSQANSRDVGTYEGDITISDTTGVSAQQTHVTLNITDSAGPEVAVSTPSNGSAIKAFSTISGTASDAGGVAGNVVNFTLYNVNTSAYWTGNGWSANVTQLVAPLNASTGVWTWNGALPSASTNTLRTGQYALSASTRDVNNNLSTPRSGINNITFTVDNSPPVITIGNPADGSTVVNLGTLAGLSVDNTKTGGAVNLFLHRLGDNAYWNGFDWIVFNGTFPILYTVYDAQSGQWYYNGNLPQPGSNAASNLTNGAYELIAVAVDAAGNQSQKSSYFTEDFAFVWTGATLHDNNPNNDSNRWDTAANWSPASVPGPGDKAVIANGDSVDLAGNRTLRAFALAGGSVNNYVITVTGAGSNLSAGTLGGTTLTVQSGATLTVDTSGSPYLDTGTINNVGTIQVRASDSANPGAFNCNNSTIKNLSGGVLQLARENGPMINSVFNQSTLTNAGTLVKSTGTGTSELGNINFVNQTNGSFGAVTGTLLISVTTTLQNGTSITGPGQTILATNVSVVGQTTVTGNLRLRSNFGFDAATLIQGAGGRLRWDSGTFAGTVSIPSGTKLEIDTTGNPYLDTTTFNNSGTIVLSASDAANVGSLNANNTSINNLSGGVIQLARESGGIINSVFNQSRLNNSGTVTKITGAGASDLGNIDLYNQANGSIGSSTSGTLRINGAAILQNGGKIAGTGPVLLVGGATFNGQTTALCDFRIQCNSSFNATTLVQGTGGRLRWDTATFFGALTIPSGTKLEIDTAGNPYLDTTTVNNSGTITLSTTSAANPGVLNGNNASIVNKTGGRIEVARSGQVINSIFNLANIVNQAGGTLIKLAASTGRSVLGFQVNNDGVVQADGGFLALDAGSTGAGGAGVYNSTAAGRVEFSGGQHILKTGARLAGAGRALLSGGQLTVAGAVSVGTSTAAAGGFEQMGGTLNGAGSFSVLGGTGACSWSGGTISTTYNLGSGAALSIDQSGSPYFDTAVLNNSGTITVLASVANTTPSVKANNSTLNNQSAGVIRFARDGTMIDSIYNQSRISNSGTVIKSAGTGTTELGNIDFNNQGTGILGATSGTLNLTTGASFANGSRVTGPGAVSLNNGATFTGQTTVTGDLRFQSGGKSFNAAMLVQGTGGRLRCENTAFSGLLAIPAGTLLEVDTTALPYLDTLVLNNSGTVRLSASNASSPGTLRGNNSTFNNLGGATVQLARDGMMLETIFNASTLVNTGTIIKTAGTGTTTLGTFGLDHRGTLSAPANTVLLVNGGLTVSAPAQIAGAGKVSVGDTTIRSALTVASGSTLEFGSAGGTFGGATDVNGNPLGTINGPGTWRLVGNTVTGKLNLGSTLRTAINNTNNIYFDTLTLNNAGTMTLTGGAGTFQANNSAFTNQAVGVFQVLSKISLTNIFNVSSFVNSGTILLGSAPVVLTNEWNFTQTGTGILDVALAGTNAATPQFSQFKATSPVTLGGTLRATVASGFVPANGSKFAAVTFPSRTGADFATVTYPNAPTGTVFTRTTTATDTTLTAAVIPKITSPTTATVKQGSAFTYQIVATNTPTSYGATGLPAGLTISTSTGKITGTPTPPGSYTVALTATNGAGAGKANLALTVQAAAPTISSVLTATANVGNAFTYQIIANNSPTSYGASGLPSGLAIATSTGNITGTPKTAGTYTVTLAAFNATGAGTAKLTLTVKALPVITSVTTASANVGSAFAYQITATNTPTSYGASGLPSGLTVATSTGKISGTPKTAGTFIATIAAFNASGSGSAKLTFTVKSLPVVTSALTVSGKVGVAFTYQIAATNTPTSYGASGLPSGLTVATSTGKITGTPKIAGTYAVTVAAFNAAGSGSAKVTMTIAASTPVITSAKTASGKVGTAFVYQIVASNTPTSYGATGLPAGLSVSASTGKISGTPTAAATSAVTLSASNSAGKGTATLTLTISAATNSADKESADLAKNHDDAQAKPADPFAPGALPQIISAAAVDAQMGQPFDYQIAANFPVQSYTAEKLPQGLTLDAATGAITGTPVELGAFDVKLSATGKDGKAAAEIVLVMTIRKEPVTAPVITSALAVNAQATLPMGYLITADSNPVSFAAEGLPSGLTVNAYMGLIVGIPTTPGEYPIVLHATNQGGTGTATMVLTVAAAPKPVASVAANVAQATVGSTATGQVTITLSAPATQDLYIGYEVKGDAINGTDYRLLKGYQTIKAGRTSASIRVVPQGDLGGAASKSVEIVLEPGTDYEVGTPAPVEVKILPSGK